MTIPIFYLDTCVIIAYLNRESDRPKVDELIELARDGKCQLKTSAVVGEELLRNDLFDPGEGNRLSLLVLPMPGVARFGEASYGEAVYGSEEQASVDEKLREATGVGPFGPEQNREISATKARNVFKDHEHLLSSLFDKDSYLVTSDKKLRNRIKRILPEYASRAVSIDEAIRLAGTKSKRQIDPKLDRHD